LQKVAAMLEIELQERNEPHRNWPMCSVPPLNFTGRKAEVPAGVRSRGTGITIAPCRSSFRN
jgi:hypothetical protein